MALPDAATVAAKWASRAGSAGQDYLAGAQRTDKDPTALAIAAKPRLIANFQARVNDGTWESRLRAVGKAGWLAAVADKGVANYQTGVSQAEGKVAQAFGPLLAFEANLQRQIQSMPANTDAERENRALAWMRGMRQYRPA